MKSFALSMNLLLVVSLVLSPLAQAASGEESKKQSDEIFQSQAASVARELAKSLEVMAVDEQDVLAEATRSQTPTLLKIQSGLANVTSQAAQFERRFEPTAFAGAQFSETNEQALISFSPVFTPTRQIQMGVQNQFKYGFGLKATVSEDSRTAESLSLERASTLVFSTEFTIDLWKDIFGRTSRAQSSALDAQRESEKIRAEIESKVFQTQVRNLYWQLVANREATIVNERLLEQSKLQVTEARKRLKRSISDKGEVARYESQVAEREANLTLLTYQRDLIVQKMKELIPSLVGKSIQLKEYNVDAKITEVLACMNTITSQKEVPFQYTLWDEYIAEVERTKVNQEAANDRLEDVDLKLVSELKLTGVDSTNPGTIGGAWNDILNNDRFGYTVGLQLSVPLGGSGYDEEEIAKTRDDARNDAAIQETRARLKSMHEQINRSMAYLTAVIQLQRVNSSKLQIRVEDIQRKFRQARVSVTDLINEQDALLAAELSVINTQTEILNQLLTYFTVFTETDCSFNQLKPQTSPKAAGDKSALVQFAKKGQ